MAQLGSCTLGNVSWPRPLFALGPPLASGSALPPVGYDVAAKPAADIFGAKSHRFPKYCDHCLRPKAPSRSKLVSLLKATMDHLWFRHAARLSFRL